MNKYFIPIIFLLISCSEQPQKKVSQTEYGDKWPLTLSDGILSCENPTRIVFTTNDNKKFGVNGSATNDYPSILEITKDTENLGVKFKMPVDFLIEEGIKLCK